VKKQILFQVIPACFLDNTQSWKLMSDGSYERLTPEQTEREPFTAHNFFMENASLSGKGRSVTASQMLHLEDFN
jgi:polyphosphate kinase